MNDLEFVQSCVRGDKLAWNEFVDKYSRLIYKYINSILEGHNPGLASAENKNDIFQEIFVILSKEEFKKLKTFKAKNGASLATWLRQVVVNYTLDYLKQHRPAVSLEEENEDGLNLKDLLTDNSVSSRDGASRQEKLKQLEECIGTLDTQDKYFLEFHIHRGLSLQIMSKLLRVSRGAIDMRKSRLIGRLRDCFKTKGFALDF